MKKAYAYTRVSTVMQIDKYSLEAQICTIRNFCDTHDIEIIGEYQDAGKSGTSTDGRDEFKKMIEDCKCNDVDYIVVFKLSRFARSLKDTINTLDEMQKYDVNLISVDDNNLDTSTSMGMVYLSLMATFAELERENIMVQTMAGRKRKAEKGLWNGGFAPYGYILNDKKELEIVPDQADIVRIIFDKYVNEERSARWIAKYLLEHGYYNSKSKNRTNELISSSQIYRIIDSEVYCGKITYGKSEIKKKKGTSKKVRVKTDNYIISEGQHEAIISEELWQQAHNRRLEEKANYVNYWKTEGHRYILSNIIKCPVCGRGLSGNSSRGKIKKDGTRYADEFYYRCKHYIGADGHKCTFKRHIRINLIDNAVEELVSQMVSNEKFEELLKDKINATVSVDEVNEEIKRLQKLLEEQNKKERNLDRQLELLDIDDKYYEKKYEKINTSYDILYDEISKINICLDEAQERKQRIEKSKINNDAIYAILKNFDKLYNKCTLDEKYELMHALIEDIQIFEAKQETGQVIKSITFKFPLLYKGELADKFFLTTDNHVETVVELVKKIVNAKEHITVTLDSTEFEATRAECKATYQQIKKYIYDNYGIKMHTQFIAEIKREVGIIERKNYNKSKKTEEEQNKAIRHCTDKNRKIILEAFKHFKMI